MLSNDNARINIRKTDVIYKCNLHYDELSPEIIMKNTSSRFYWYPDPLFWVIYPPPTTVGR